MKISMRYILIEGRLKDLSNLIADIFIPMKREETESWALYQAMRNYAIFDKTICL
jgi:hypothetical protein